MVICAICDGKFDGIGPSDDWGHNTVKCVVATAKRLKVENGRMRAALEVLSESAGADQWVRALAMTALDGKIPLSA